MTCPPNHSSLLYSNVFIRRDYGIFQPAHNQSTPYRAFPQHATRPICTAERQPPAFGQTPVPMQPQSSGDRSGPWSTAWRRSEEHTSELQSLMRISYAVFCLKKKNKNKSCPTEIRTSIPTSKTTVSTT